MLPLRSLYLPAALQAARASIASFTAAVRAAQIALVSILLARDTLKIIRFPKYRPEGAHFS
jgi:hypothetical protein